MGEYKREVETMGGGRRTWGVCTLLVIVYLVVRLVNLREMPAFCDEAIYVRWGQLVRQEPLRNLWVSMIDAKLPVHYWLLALFYRVTGDPILSGRVLSVLVGAVAIPLLFGLGREMGRLAVWRGERGGDWTWFGVVAGLVVIFSPVVALFQRMALAEALLVTEGLAMAWWGLRMARQVAEGRERSVLLRDGVVLGILWGVMLATKQNFSYLYAAVPVLALVVYGQRGTWGGTMRQAWGPLAVGAAVGLAIFVPLLFTDDTYPLSVRLFYKTYFHRPPQFSRAWMVGQNLFWFFVPWGESGATVWPHDAAAPLRYGALWGYFTPPMYGVLVAAVVGAVMRRAWSVVVFLGGWAVLLIVPLGANPNMQVVRYTLPGMVPLLLIAAWGLSAAVEWPWRRAGGRVMAAGLLAAVLAWPACATVWQARDPWAPTMLAMDRAEYLYAWSSCDFAERAVDFFRAEARKGPITLVTGTRFGENDYYWVYLRDEPTVALYCTDSPTLPVKPWPEDTRTVLGTEEWFLYRKAEVVLKAGRPVYRTVQLATDERGVVKVDEDWSRFGAYARCVKVILNKVPPGKEGAIGGIAVLRVEAPGPERAETVRGRSAG
jgi:hypothetical protein